ncbi:RHS repeat-associated core domain-containing protein [Erysipelothrix sp. D19-032]
MTIEESYVLDLSMEYPSVVENYKNGKLTNSTVYSFEAAMHDTISETRYLVSNIKDDIVLNVGKKQNVQMYDYDFFGKPTSLLPQNLGYSGEVHDGAIQYLRARYYDTETGVFLTRDTYHGDSKDIGSQNRYTYVQNNPINRVDPSGHFFKNLWNSVVNTVSNVVSSVVDFGKSVVDFGRKVFNTVVNAVVQPIKSVYESVKEVGSTIYHSISSSSRSSNRNNVVNAPAPKIIKKTKLQLAIEAKQRS